jgi:hypothetical protein
MEIDTIGIIWQDGLSPCWSEQGRRGRGSQRIARQPPENQPRPVNDPTPANPAAKIILNPLAPFPAPPRVLQ